MDQYSLLVRMLRVFGISAAANETNVLIAEFEAEFERFMGWPAGTATVEPCGTRKFLMSHPANVVFNKRRRDVMAHMCEYVNAKVPDGRMKFAGFQTRA